MSCPKFLEPVVRGALLDKRAEISIPKKENISEISKQRPKAQGLQITSGHTITLLTFKTFLSLIKVVLEQERHWKRGIPN